MSIQINQVSYNNWPHCIRMSNASIELILTTDIGPRVIRLGFIGEANEFFENKEDMGKTGGEQYRFYGGHRLWHAPEIVPRTYCPDNQPIQTNIQASSVTLTTPVESTTGIQKEIIITLDPDKPQARLQHRLTNHNVWAVSLSAWAISIMAPGGVGILPLPPYGSHVKNLLPTTALSLWAYTNLADPRWSWHSRAILLKQDSQAEFPQKIGVNHFPGWLAYLRDGHLFVKKFASLPNTLYPDKGSSAEMFTNNQMLELESLSPFVSLEPGQSIEHDEYWYLERGIVSSIQPADVESYLLPFIEKLIS